MRKVEPEHVYTRLDELDQAMLTGRPYGSNDLGPSTHGVTLARLTLNMVDGLGQIPARPVG